MCQRHVPSLSLSLSPLFSQRHAGSHGSKRNQKGRGGAKKFGWDINDWHGWGRTKKKKLYKRGWGRKEESKLSSRMEAVRNFETHNLNVVSFFCVCLLWVERAECVWDREDRQKATGQVSCPGPWLGQIGSWIWAYQPGWSFGFWLSGGPSYTWVVLRYSQCQELTVSKCVHEPI